MFRLVLVAYLTLITLAGPAVCCCTASQLMGSVLPGSKESPMPTNSHCHGHRAGGSCHGQHSQHQGTAVHHKATRPADRSEPPAHPCACHETRFEALNVKASDADAAQLLRLQFEFISVPTEMTASLSMLGHCSAVVPSTLEATTFPHMSAPEILRALQTFRC